MKLLLAVCALAALSVVAAQQNYAILVAGSNGYYNYRHQSDICHAFQILTDPTKGNFPKENIIVFMYDDIANDPSNPVKGNLINHPSGPNVYPGVTKDYTGAAVTPENFLAVIQGNSSGVTGGSGRVLQSTAQDNVFIYFSDHGAAGLVAFPSSYLYATDMIKAFNYMHDHKMYKEMVVYIEACESGSMFANILPTGINIYATSASTPDQSSYACYYDSTRQTYLGDEYSVRWMEDADVHDSATSTWSLNDQFKVVFNQTIMSQPQQYGQLTIAAEPIEHFEGYKEGAFIGNPRKRKVGDYTPCGTSTDSRDVKLHYLMNRRDLAKTTQEQARWQVEVEAELKMRAQADYTIDKMLQTIMGPKKNLMKSVRHPLTKFDCLKAAVRDVEVHCGKFNDYSLKWIYTLANMCEEGVSPVQIAKVASDVCSSL